MRPGASTGPSQPGPEGESVGSPAPPAAHAEGAQSISIRDASGKAHEGLLLRLDRWDDGAASRLQELQADFHIVVLGEPPSGPVQPPPRTVVCAPARSPEQPAAVREAAVAYQTDAQREPPAVTATEAALLCQGRLYALPELRITAQEAFDGGQPRFELLARELLTAEALAGYLTPMAVALAAPGAPLRASTAQRLAALRALLRDAQAGLTRDQVPEAAAALERLSHLSAAEDPEPFLASAGRLYPLVPTLLEDIYLARGLAERPDEAHEVLAMRDFLSQAAVPAGDPDLRLDKAIATEQLQFASLIPEPQRLNTARAALEQFRSRYRNRYQAHHRTYWTEMAHLRGRLLEGKAHAEALDKINTLTELGPPVGAGALMARGELLEETGGCPLIVGVEEELSDSPVCPACRLRLDQEPPSERVTEVLQRIERALGRQMARLSSVGVRQVLERSGDSRVERFLKVVQAAQLSSLVDVMDDDLMGYLRRFLVESRIGSLLDPILSRLQEGAPPKAEEAQESLRDIARVLQRAFRAGGRALPPPRGALKDGAVRKAKR